MDEPIPVTIEYPHNATSWVLSYPPEPNMKLLFGDNLALQFDAKKTKTNRMKFWVLCKLLPFKVVKWEK